MRVRAERLVVLRKVKWWNQGWRGDTVLCRVKDRELCIHKEREREVGVSGTVVPSE